ncbi:MAG: hypothetical protein NVV70_06500 [Cellulomonas sp.]|uniref:hypothetical protein n=1 Tax=Cellulomonas sp. TaxID=40001 RepID=UPI00258BE352|nr:hypothetical protein [Cellulomonas sp.]MCR6647794.1 hypothetical protein [Cellulomonas sp.]MCR6703152.1 hypothetical protein [Cellulomonas sp.]
MTKDRVLLHHPETKAEREFAPRTVDAWKRAGWIAGALPGAADDETAIGDASASSVDEADDVASPVDDYPTAAGKTAAKK